MTEYSCTIGGLKIYVNKVGGGTLGETYEGYWQITVMNGPVFKFDNAEFVSRKPVTHYTMAHMAYDTACELIGA